jgi:hypothetical protein
VSEIHVWVILSVNWLGTYLPAVMIIIGVLNILGHVVAQCLTHYATSRKVADEVIEFYQYTESFWPH